MSLYYTIYNTILTYTILTYTILTYIILTYTNLTYTILTYTILTYTILTYTILTYCTIYYNSIETGMQNSALAVVLAQHFPNPILSSLPGAISATCHSVIGSLLAAICYMA